MSLLLMGMAAWRLTLPAFVDEPELRQDPPYLESASREFYRVWRRCRASVYPAQVGWHEYEFDIALAFEPIAPGPAPRELEARLSIHGYDGEQESRFRPSAPETRKFMACVTKRFGKPRYRSVDGAARGPWGRTPPYFSFPADAQTSGRLLVAPAREHVLGSLLTLRASCGGPRADSHNWTVTVVVLPDGQVESMSHSGIAPTKVALCIKSRLATMLHFPQSRERTEIRATGTDLLEWNDSWASN